MQRKQHEVTPNLKNARKRKTESQNDQQNTEGEASSAPLPTDDWEFPKTPSKRRPPPAGKEVNATTDNKFQALAEESEMEEDILTNDDTTPARTNTTKRHRPPPIYLTNTNMKDIIDIINNLKIQKKEISVHESNGNGIKSYTIYTTSPEIYAKIKQALDELKLEFYTYTPKEEKPKSFIIKGIKGHFTADDIKAELSELALPGVVVLSVTNFHFDKENAEKHHHLVQVTSDSPTTDLLKVKSLAYQRVHWERLRKPLLYQCRRCQRIGHSGKNCHLAFRCVKCAEAHGPGKCPIDNASGKEALKCSNCGQSGHPASYRGCPYIKIALRIKRNQQREAKASVQRKINNIAPIQTNRTFAQAVRMPHTTRPTAAWNNPTTAPAQYPTLPRHNDIQHVNDDNNNQLEEAKQRTPTQQPSWISELKNDIALLISEQLKAISTQVAQNTARIDYILNSLNNK